jgi:hypothetical protein
LVCRHGELLEPTAEELLQALEPHLVRREVAASWPGTKLHQATAQLSWFAYNYASYSTVKEAVTGLYEWQHPAYPEDLCLMRGDGSEWLVSIAHERWSDLTLAESELADVRSRVPQLVLRLIDGG